eukprot:CAMPEP_0201672400 /NCGR_PEP_ID=MMETSP0494-20130426/32120_1 /ASSEMBLY_ACC=CAM_ASM_000839 /TAXON_ID=420259 /ORGANISM="Thalassiosira gravida, Strain GMp14c1" /LENGTH=45 /DNA_ID= /DNA_START= /DNA_END= /DNA_ORIENTATION=
MNPPQVEQQTIMTRGRHLESVGHDKDADESNANDDGGVSPSDFEE